MSFLLKGQKEDLLELATELRLEATVDMTKPMLKNLITRSAGYDEEDTKLMYEGIVEERKERELFEERKERELLEERKERELLEERKRQDNLELEKLRIEAQIGLNQEMLSRNNRTPKCRPGKRISSSECRPGEVISAVNAVRVIEFLQSISECRPGEIIPSVNQ
ncbi:hypothetical protein TNCT_510161 [Trichonephila clavata]|uniref:Uncharacterized protein n=1 Tax=Trichonephila clavata TaxID=2740835 RepID=A0A8X6HBW5_TRICU|nr:hypothetical protein TNCT_510161 [Trichonephila clavata]